MLLKDKITLVTGAGRGLGRAVAMAYARQGARVIATARTQTELEGTAEMIRAEGGVVRILSADIALTSAVQQMAEQVLSDFGGIDVLVNNAARLPLVLFEEASLEEWDRTINVNLRGPFLTCKLFLDSLKRRGAGSIINVSSRAGVEGFPRETAYCASKFGLEGFSRALAIELRAHNIAVNTITPGGVSYGVRIKPTSVTQAQYDAMNEQDKAQWQDPMLLTEAFVFLALQDASGTTGQRIYAYPLSEQIRREGWDIQYKPDNTHMEGGTRWQKH
jgi:NAD(P)-dependent dehydrogenase (short-subunit alcohol dehydrogenase family)